MSAVPGGGGSATTTWIVAGLGNPGPRYLGTRHDLGAALVTRVARGAGASFTAHADADVARAEGLAPGGVVMLVRPTLFMNRSGPPIRRLLEEEGLGPDRLVVACDDLNLPLGKIRVRQSGSAGGHNGLRSIIEAVGEGFPRLRIGIGPEPAGADRAAWVLSRFDEQELGIVAEALDEAESALLGLLRQPGCSRADAAVQEKGAAGSPAPAHEPGSTACWGPSADGR